MEIKSTNKELKLLHVEDHFINLFNTGSSIPCSETATIVDEYLQAFPENLKFSTESIQAKLDHSITSLCTIRSKRRSVSFSDKVDYLSKSYSHFSNYQQKYYNNTPKSIFGKKETTVYMTLFNDFCRRRTSGSQATASINKCLQVTRSTAGAGAVNNYYVHNPSSPDYCSTCNTSTLPYPDSRKQSIQDNRVRSSDVYFFGKKKDDQNRFKGMGFSKFKKSGQKVTAAQVQNDPVHASSASVQANSPSNTTAAQTKRSSGGSNNGKMVSIKESKPCPAAGTKGEMMATVSHIRIGPKDPCPVHGREPCQGPKCIVAASGADEQAPVKVSTMTNPRRGVFELVIRRMTGAPLAKNELMLEWTPPPSRPPPCGSPCPTPCYMGPPCRPSRCKMIVCRPSPCRPAKCCKKACKRPCGPMPCRPVPCKKCCRSSCCGKTCRPCKPCPPPSRCRPCPPSPRCRPCSPPRCRPCSPPRCRPCSPPRYRTCSPPRCRPCSPPHCKPCPPSPRCGPCSPPRCKPCPPSPCKSPCGPPCCQTPCKSSCCQSSCTASCKSSPCLRRCPVGYRRPRKIRSQPKIKAHRKLISPCYNRSKACPVVRCRSVPGPCFGCCSVPPCPPRKCCSVFPCPTRKCYPVFTCPVRKCCIASPCPPRKWCPISPCATRKCCSVSPCKHPKCCKSSCSNC